MIAEPGFNYAPLEGTSLQSFIEERMSQPQTSAYSYPLGYNTWSSEEVMAALDCLTSRQTTMWDKTETFEKQFANYVGVEHAVMVNSGSSADLVLMLAAKEMGLLQYGDEILIPAVTWPTQVWSAVQAGFSVRLVDVKPSTFNTSAEILEKSITPKTKALFLVHLMGNPCDMDEMRDLARARGLLIFEDCCEALGSTFNGQKVGSFGVAGTFSFFASHHISTMEGGMIATNDPAVADACRLVRAHGWARDLKQRKQDVEVLSRYGTHEDPRYLFLGMGFNFRPTELNAEIGRIQLTKLDTMNAYRAKHFDHIQLYFRSTNGHFVKGVNVNYKAKPAWFALPFILQEGLPYTRNQVFDYLKRWGVDTRPIVGGNLMRHPAFWRYRDMQTTSLDGANTIHDLGFYIGLPPIDCSMDSVTGFLNGMDAILKCA